MMLRRLWNMAPVYTTNLMEEGLVDASLNETISRAAVTAFDNYVVTRRRDNNGVVPLSDNGPESKRRRRRRPTTRGTCGEASFSQPMDTITEPPHEVATKTTDNDHFFEHQRTNGYPLANNSKEASLLMEYINNSVVHYLKEACHFQKGPAVVQLMESNLVKVDMWATVQRGVGAYHASHVHEGAIVSGVYYANVPKGSAPLLLCKPSHVNPTYSNHEFGDGSFEDNGNGNVLYYPRQGNLILFPPWLNHGVPFMDNSVETSVKQQARVTFAFNVAGAYSWGDPWDVTRMP